MSSIQVPLTLAIPPLGALSKEARNACRVADECLSQVTELNDIHLEHLQTSSPEELFQGDLSDCVCYFHDPLKERYKHYHDLNSTDDERRGSSTKSELVHLAASVVDLHSAIDSACYEGFLQYLEKTSSLILGAESRIRTRPVYLAADRRGEFIEYLECGKIHEQLRVLFEHVCGEGASPTYRAAVCYVLLVGSHPFFDGNGRLARIAANAVLRHANVPKGGYVPIKEFFGLSRGAVSIQTRRAQFRGDWSGIVTSFGQMIELTTRFPTSDVGSKSPELRS